MEGRRAVAGNTATGVLKLAALALMAADHAGQALFPGVIELRLIGRVAFPLYAWCLVVGFERTRSVPRYLGRMALLGLVSQPLYVLAMGRDWTEPNILLTLCLALCALWGIRENRGLSRWWAPALALVLAYLLKCDYDVRGILLVLLIYVLRGNRGALAAGLTLFCLLWGVDSMPLNFIFGQRIHLKGALLPLLSPWLRVQCFAALSVPLIVCRFPGDIRMPAWLGYGLYPAHLLVLYLLDCCL